MKFELRKTLKKINREFGLTMVIVNHDRNASLTCSDTVVVMNHGAVIQGGGPQELLDRPAATHAGSFSGRTAPIFLPATVARDRIVRAGSGLSAPCLPG